MNILVDTWDSLLGDLAKDAYYCEPAVILFLGDSLDILPRIPKESVDLILTDPPYGISQKKVKINRDNIQKRSLKRGGKKSKELNYDFGKWDHYETIEEQLEFMEKWLLPSHSLLKPVGQLISFYSKSEISFFEYILGGIGFHVRQTLVWHKTNPVPQIFKVGYMSACEFLIWATKNTGAGHTFNYQLGQKHNVFTYPICQGHERTNHPTQKPQVIISDLLTYHTREGDLILDPFLGSGTTAVASKKLGRRCIGIEMEKEYLDISVQRLSQGILF